MTPGQPLPPAVTLSDELGKGARASATVTSAASTSAWRAPATLVSLATSCCPDCTVFNDVFTASPVLGLRD